MDERTGNRSINIVIGAIKQLKNSRGSTLEDIVNCISGQPHRRDVDRQDVVELASRALADGKRLGLITKYANRYKVKTVATRNQNNRTSQGRRNGQSSSKKGRSRRNKKDTKKRSKTDRRYKKFYYRYSKSQGCCLFKFLIYVLL